MATQRRARKSALAKKKPVAAKPAYVSKHPAKQRTRETLALIERLRTICLALPNTTEQIAWGEPTWRVGGRMFAQCDTYHHGSPHLSVHIPAPLGAQEALIDAEPERFYRPPYVGGKGWVAIILDTKPNWKMVAELIGTAYELIATKEKRPRRMR